MTTLQLGPFVSHTLVDDDKKQVLARIITRLIKTGQQALIPLAEQLAEGVLGFAMMQMEGMNAFVTDELLRHMEGQHDCNPADIIAADQILYDLPIIRANQERFVIFQQQIKEYWKELFVDRESKIASIPCGYMRDLITLGLDSDQITLVGIDKDPSAIEGARNFAHRLGIENVEFLIEDAKTLSIENEFHIITSNGFNIHLRDEKAIQLYQSLFNALAEDGMLVISQLTPPEEWNREFVDDEEVDLEQKVLGSIIGPRFYPYFRSSERMTLQLEKAGFAIERIIPDTARRMPTFVAKKRSNGVA